MVRRAFDSAPGPHSPLHLWGSSGFGRGSSHLALDGGDDCALFAEVNLIRISSMA